MRVCLWIKPHAHQPESAPTGSAGANAVARPCKRWRRPAVTLSTPWRSSSGNVVHRDRNAHENPRRDADR